MLQKGRPHRLLMWSYLASADVGPAVLAEIAPAWRAVKSVGKCVPKNLKKWQQTPLVINLCNLA